MKLFLLPVLAICLLFGNCNFTSSKGVNFKYTVETNFSIAILHWKLWKGKIDNEPDIDARINQTGECLSAYGGLNSSSSLRYQQSVYFDNFFSYNMGYQHPTMIFFYAKDYDINIIDSIPQKREINVYKEGQLQYKALFNFWFYKLRYKDSTTWFLGKIDTEEYFSGPKNGFGHAVYGYNFYLENTEIISRISINIPNYLRESIREFGITLPLQLNYFTYKGDEPKNLYLYDKNKERMLNRQSDSLTRMQYEKYTIIYNSVK
ncbi:MAG: hypothetical protein MUC87_18625 [Bacteroidia bacterium]|jgi:hypothetical protein|nr:hypothetical protein [Bacteroidia bacterium]